ncbi:MAG: hypothetical protein ACP5NQ_08410 [Vulcanisaeta sp.]
MSIKHFKEISIIKLIELPEKPLPKSTSEDYINTGLLKSIVETTLTLKFLRDGLVRNTAGKAFQTWHANNTFLC